MKNSRKKEKRTPRLRTAVLAGSLAAVLTIPAMLAYLTDFDENVNKFTFASNLTAEVVEPSWDTTDKNSDGVPDAAENVVPNQVIAKDPAITVTGSDAYVWMEVTIPRAAIVTDGESVARENPIFEFTANTGKWESVSTTKPNGYVKHVYRYTGGDNGVLAAGETTEPLFTSVTVPNITSNNGKEYKFDDTSIVVKAHAIQAEGFANADAAWAAYRNQTDN